MKTLLLLALSALVWAGPASAQAQNAQLTFAQAAVVGTMGAGAANAALWDMAVIADGQGNTYLAGSFAGTVNFGAYVLTSSDSRNDVFVAKRNAAGTYLWAEQGGGPGEQRCTALAVDAAGNVYVTGHFSSVPTATFGSTVLTNATVDGREQADAFVAKLHGATHAWEWANRAGGGTRINGQDYGTAIAVDGLGNVYVAGNFNSSVAFFGTGLQVFNPYPGFDNVFLGKLTPSGAWVWAKGQQYMGMGASGLSVDVSQNVYLTGSYGGQVQFGRFVLTSGAREVFIAKIDGNGTWQWANGTGPTRSSSYQSRFVSASAVTSDGGNGLYLAGSFGYGVSHSPDTLIVGNRALINRGAISPPGPSGQEHRTIDAYVARLDATTGAWRWAMQSTGLGNEWFARPQVDGSGHVYASGTFGEPDFQHYPLNTGNGFGSTTLFSAGSNDVVVAQLDTVGRWIWARQTGGTGSEAGALCSMDAQGRGVLMGSFVGPTGQVGSFTLPQFNPGYSGSYSFFLAALGTNGPLASQTAAAMPVFDVFPNPAHTSVSVGGLRPGQPVEVLDVLGRQVMAGRVPLQGPLQLPLPAGLPVGLYIIRADAQARRLVVE